MNKAVVFGGGGFVGSAVVDALLAHGVEVCAVVKPGFWDSPEAFRLRRDIPVVECDLREVSGLKRKLPFQSADVFYQLAWEGNSGDAMLNPQLQLQNVGWQLDSISLASELQCEKWIGAGTISQDELKTPAGRASQGDRHRIFRTAALTTEYMGQSVAHQYGVQFLWPIISNVYGEGELIPRLITTLIRALLNDMPMPLSSGEQLYDFIYRADAGEAYYRIGKSGIQGSRYNISGGKPKALRSYLEELRDIVAPGAELQFGARAGGGIQLDYSSFDISTLQKDTGFEPAVSFEMGISRLKEWMLRH